MRLPAPCTTALCRSGRAHSPPAGCRSPTYRIGAPGMIAGAFGGGERLAVRVRAAQSTEIAAPAGAAAGDEERHHRLLAAHRQRTGGAPAGSCFGAPCEPAWRALALDTSETATATTSAASSGPRKRAADVISSAPSRPTREHSASAQHGGPLICTQVADSTRVRLGEERGRCSYARSGGTELA